MLAFSNDYYGLIFRATQSVELFCAYVYNSGENIYYYFYSIPESFERETMQIQKLLKSLEFSYVA